MNGRIVSDKGVGKITCHNKTLIDYAIGSAEMLCKSQNFEADDFNPLFSDVHNPIKLTFNRKISFLNNFKITDEDYNMDFDHRVKLKFQWGEDNKEIFLNNIDEKELENIITKLNQYKTLNSNEGDI